MIHRIAVLSVLLGIALPCNSQAGGKKEESALRLMLSEVQPGAMSSEHYCMLVFADHAFHAEKASHRKGSDQERKVYEGHLADADWNTLDKVLEDDQFRKLNVPATYVPLVVQDSHPYTISVRREKGFQNMEFMDNNSRKPYGAQLKPLIRWWNSVRSKRMTPSEAPADSRCALDSSHGVFSF